MSGSDGDSLQIEFDMEGFLLFGYVCLPLSIGS